jgi:hypothetical protein
MKQATARAPIFAIGARAVGLRRNLLFAGVSGRYHQRENT